MAQKLKKALLRHGRCDQIALTKVAAHHRKCLQIGGALDPFGNCGAVESMCQVDRRLADRGICCVDRALLDEAAVELELDKR